MCLHRLIQNRFYGVGVVDGWMHNILLFVYNNHQILSPIWMYDLILISFLFITFLIMILALPLFIYGECVNQCSDLTIYVDCFNWKENKITYLPHKGT